MDRAILGDRNGRENLVNFFVVKVTISGALCHIGLAKDRGGHLVNQPRVDFVRPLA